MTESTIRTALVRPMILIVDDEPAVLEALDSLLSPRVEPLYRVETALSAEEALELVESREDSPVALIISDEKMPGLSGTEFLTKLRGHSQHRDGGRILITGYAGLDSAKRAINDAEVDKYYPKPWKAEEELLPAVGTILERFARQSGWHECLLVQTAAAELTNTLSIRRESWRYATYLDDVPEEEDRPLSSFRSPEDDEATHLEVFVVSPRARQPAASIRLRISDDPTFGTLESLAFWPEHANDRVESLLLQAALLEAQRQGVEHVAMDAPRLRHEIYERLGFTAKSDDEASAQLPMECALQPPTAIDRARTNFASRYARERRLCACQQTECAQHEYAEERRSYLCPLDIIESRLPSSFPESS